jgi:hypothetical protein
VADVQIRPSIEVATCLLLGKWCVPSISECRIIIHIRFSEVVSMPHFWHVAVLSFVYNERIASLLKVALKEGRASLTQENELIELKTHVSSKP